MTICMISLGTVYSREEFISAAIATAGKQGIPGIFETIYDSVTHNRIDNTGVFQPAYPYKAGPFTRIRCRPETIDAYLLSDETIRGGKKMISRALKLTVSLSNKTIAVSDAILGRSIHDMDGNAYSLTERCLQIHKRLYKKIPDAISQYPDWTWDRGTTIEYAQLFYPTTWAHYRSSPLFTQVAIGISICDAFTQLHGINYVHGDFNLMNVFVEKVVDGDGEVKSYTSRLHDFDLSDSLYTPYPWSFYDDAHSQQETIDFSLSLTPAFDILRFTVCLYNTCYYGSSTNHYFSVTNFIESDYKSCMKTIDKKNNNYLIKHLHQIPYNTASDNREVAIRARIGTICKQVIQGYKDLQKLGVEDDGFYGLLRLKTRTNDEIKRLLDHIYARLPRACDLQAAYTNAISSKILQGDKLASHLQMEHPRFI